MKAKTEVPAFCNIEVEFQLNKNVFELNFNFYQEIMRRFFSKFGEEYIIRGHIVPAREVFSFFGRSFSLPKEKTKLLIKDLEQVCPFFKRSNQGIRITMEGEA